MSPPATTPPVGLTITRRLAAACTPEEQQHVDIACLLADVGELPARLAEALLLFVWDTDRLPTYPAPIRTVELGRPKC